MKAKVDKKEWDDVLLRLNRVEAALNHMMMFEANVTKKLYDTMEDYFKTKCINTIVKRDREIIAGEIKREVIDNLFKEKSEEITSK